MSISRPFAYNPTLQTDGVSEQFGTLAVGFTGQTYQNSPGGLKWWNGPDEELGYVISTSLPTGGPLGPDGTQSTVGFWRTNGFSDQELIQLSETLTGQNFVSSSDAMSYLRSNGYWTSTTGLTPYNIVVGGLFTIYSGQTANNIIGLNYNGSINSEFAYGTGFNGEVETIIKDNNQKIIIGGRFTTYQGVNRGLLVRLNTDGSYDTSFDIGSGFSPTAILNSFIDTNNKILLIGLWSTFNGSAIPPYLARLNSNGTYDNSYSVGEFNFAATAAALQSDNKIIIAGSFTTYSGLTANGICRLNDNASLDNSFSAGNGFNQLVRSIKIQTDGKLIVGGGFTTYDGVTSNRIVRINSNGSLDSTFNIGSGFNNTVESIAIQFDGKILIGGNFNTYNGVSVGALVRLNTDGTIDSTFNTGSGPSGFIFSIVIDSSNKILIGGNFGSYNGVNIRSFARINSDGSLDTTFLGNQSFTDVVNVSVTY